MKACRNWWAFFFVFFLYLCIKITIMKWTEDKIKDKFLLICTRIEMGEALRNILKSDGMPAPATFYGWLENEDRMKRYARCCEARSEAIFEEILAIADDKSEDYIPTKGGAVGNNAAVQRARLQVDARKWIVSKLNPKKYSDKIQNEVSGDMAINWIETKTNDINK